MPILRKENLVILESTCSPGTTKDFLAPILARSGLKIGEEVYLAYCPERVLPGRILEELIENERVIGGINLKLAQKAQVLYWEYRIVGACSEYRALKRLSNELGVNSRVKFFGRLTYEQTMEEMAQCDVFSLPSRGEPFGKVYLEAMARGRPVIGCRGAGAEEMVKDGLEGLLVEPRDLKNLKAALLRLLSEPELCSRMGSMDRKSAEQFSCERNARHYLELFRASSSRSCPNK